MSRRLDELARSLAGPSGRHDAELDAFARSLGRPVRRRTALKLMGGVAIAGIAGAGMAPRARAGTYCPNGAIDCGPVVNNELRGECCDQTTQSCCTGGSGGNTFVSCCSNVTEQCDPSIGGCRCKDELMCAPPNCCKPPAQCLGPGCCCLENEECIDGGCVAVCAAGETRCERECCDSASECVQVPGSSTKRCVRRCGAGTRRCGDTCCEKSETCCKSRDDAQCCHTTPFLVCGQYTVSGSHLARCDDRCRLAGKGVHCRGACCEKGEECCGGKKCCEFGSCVDGECKCPRGQRHCKGDLGERCCPRRERCCNGATCCKRNETCCYDKCCPKDKHCASYGKRGRRQSVCCEHKSCQRTPGAKPVCCDKGETCAKLLRGGTDVGANPENVCCPPERVVRLRGGAACCPAGTLSLGEGFSVGAGATGSCCPEAQICRGPNGQLSCCPRQGDQQLACCGGTCTDVRFDYFNCGSCGHSCATEELCKPDAAGRQRTCLCRNGVCIDPYA